MSKHRGTGTGFMFPLVLLLGSLDVDSRDPGSKTNNHGCAENGIFQKMIVEKRERNVELRHGALVLLWHSQQKVKNLLRILFSFYREHVKK